MNEKTTTPNEFIKGDRVILPEWWRLNRDQSRVNIIIGIYPEEGYILMTKMLKSGASSKNLQASVYFPYKSIASLRK